MFIFFQNSIIFSKQFLTQDNLLLVLAYFVISIIIGFIAHIRGRNIIGWALLTLVITPALGLPLVLSKPNKKLKKTNKIKSSQKRIKGKKFTSTIAGVLFDTPSGQSRQDYIKNKLNVNDSLVFEHEPDNKYDPDIVAILTLDGFHLGYVRGGLFSNINNESLIIKSISSGRGVYGKVKTKYEKDNNVIGVKYEAYL